MLVVKWLLLLIKSVNPNRSYLLWTIKLPIKDSVYKANSLHIKVSRLLRVIIHNLWRLSLHLNKWQCIPHNSRTSSPTFILFFLSFFHGRHDNIFAKWQLHAILGWVPSEGESCSRARHDLHCFSLCAFRKPVMPCKWFCMIKVKLIRIEHLSFDWNNDFTCSFNFLSVHFLSAILWQHAVRFFSYQMLPMACLLNWESKYTRGGGLTRSFWK